MDIRPFNICAAIYESYLFVATLLNELNKTFQAFQKKKFVYDAVFVPD